MVQPINYGGMIAQSMEGLGPALRDVGLERQRRQQQQENQQLISNAAELYKTGTPEQIAEFSIKNPQIGDILGQQIGYRNERTKQIMADTLGRALTASPEQRREIITKGADAIRAAGGDPRNLITATEDSPEDFERGALMALASTGDYGKPYLSAYQASKPKEMTEYQKEMVRQKDTEQELKRLEIEQKKLDAQYKRETDELKRQELESKIAENEKKAAEAREAKELSKQQAITSTQQTLESVDELLNHPGLDSAVGGTSLFPTRPGSDAANFETALESFVGNLTMENMGVMKGVLSDSDIKMIRAASSGLDIGMSEKAFKARLNKIKERLQSKLKQQGGQPQQQEQQQYTEGQTATNPQTGERLVFRGGQWQTM